MSYHITGLAPDHFKHLYGLDEAALARHGALRYRVEKSPGYPDRIELRDAEVGEDVLLVNFRHHDVATPFQSSYAVFVIEGAKQRFDSVDAIPEVLQRRLLSVRGYSAEGMLLEADVVDGAQLEPHILKFFAQAEIAYLHIHYAKQGCFAARVDRA